MTESDDAPVAPPCAMVIFGAAGDLTKRLVVPALYNLVNAGRLPDGFKLIGVDLASHSTEEWRQSLTTMLDEFCSKGSQDGVDQKSWQWLTERMSYMQGDLTDPDNYQRLKSKLEGADNCLFYLAIADRFFGTVVTQLGKAGLTHEEEGKWRRVIIEKPFGHDLPTAKALNEEIGKTLEERQIYRIDHYLGKETVQNIMALRFANGLFEPIWNRAHIDHVQITAAETVGVEKRGKFYDKTGAMRDMVPNHIFQLLAMTAMEPPVSFDADAVRSKKAELIQSIRPFTEELALRDTVRGQYGASVSQGKPVPAYREEPDVAPDSTVETFVAAKLQIDNWRWAGVPFYLRTGKHLKRRMTEIAVRFHQAPHSLFRGTDVEHMNPNWMILRIQPDEGIALEFATKRPGPVVKLSNVSMDFSYEKYYGKALNTGYETLLYDAMIGDATLFQRADNIESGWRIVQPILDTWAQNPPQDFPNYESGGSGPKASDDLLARDGRAWRSLT